MNSKILEHLDQLSTSEKIDFISEVLSASILRTPNGPVRNAMTEANVIIMTEQERICPKI